MIPFMYTGIWAKGNMRCWGMDTYKGEGRDQESPGVINAKFKKEVPSEAGGEVGGMHKKDTQGP